MTRVSLCVVFKLHLNHMLATDRELDEMIRNCTNASSYVPMGVDLTFKLGQFYVCQPNSIPLKILLAESTGKSPVYFGPHLVHKNLKFYNYHYFASQLVGLCPTLKNAKAIGTDGEGPLYEAFWSTFPNAVH